MSKEKQASFAMGLVLGIAFLGFSRSIGWSLNRAFSFRLLSSYTNISFLIGVVLAMEGLLGMIVPPLVGWYSDRVFTRMGRRKPFILIGGLLAGISIYLVYFFYSIGLPLFAIGFMLSFFYFSMHLYTAPYRALMPDLIETGHRGTASGIITMFEVIGSLTGFIAGAYLWSINESYPFIMGAFLIPLASIVTYMLIGERELEEKKKKTVIKEGIIDYAKRMFGEKDTVKFYTAQTLWWMGFEFIGIFFVGIMAQAILGAPTDENIDKITVTAVYLMGLFNIAAIFTAIPGGLIYDKIGKKRAMLFGIIIFGVSIFAGLLVKTVLTAVIILIIAGLGWGIVLSSSFPVIGDLLTKYQREEFNGRYYGLFEVSRSFPILLGGFGGGAIVSLMNNNYVILFPIAGISVLISIPIVLSMHMLED